MVEAIERVNRSLQEAGINAFVFVGGATISSYLNEPGAPKPRVTVDVDVVTSVIRLSEYYELEEKLRLAGYSQPVDSPVICRWQIGVDLVDLMPASDVLGFGNRWFKPLLERPVAYRLPDGQVANIAAPQYLLASKLEAFLTRGTSDLMLSHDLDDVVILIDGRQGLHGEIASADDEVRAYIAASIKGLLEDPEFRETLPGRLGPDDASQARHALIIERMQRISELG